MTDKPDLPADEKPDADEAFAATLRNLVNTPHKPHEPLHRSSVVKAARSRAPRTKAKTAAKTTS